MPIPFLLCANKFDRIAETEDSDLEYLQTEMGLAEFANEHGFLKSYRVSAKENINIAEAFSILVREMIISTIAQSQ